MTHIEAIDLAVSEIKKVMETGSDTTVDYEEVIEIIQSIRQYVPTMHNLTSTNEVTFASYENEVFLPVKGFEDLYLVSNMCRVKSLYTNHLRKPYKRNGYYTVLLRKDNKSYTLRLCRIVASAWVPNPENKPVVDHINSNKLDDRPENLRWVTQSENMNNSNTRTNISKGHNNAILQFSLDGVFLKEWYNGNIIQKETGFCGNGIRGCCKGQYQVSHGYIWRYKKDIPLLLKIGDRIELKTTVSANKATLQYSQEGTFLKEWKSIKEAAKVLEIRAVDIRMCCEGKSKIAGGFVWKYK